MKVSNRFAVQYFLVQFGSGCIFSLLALYLKKLNFTGIQIGLLFSISTFVQLIVTPIWGILVDRVGKIKVLLLTSMAASATLCFFLAFLNSYPGWVISFFILYIFYSPVSLLSDAWCLRHNVEYGKVRRWGSIGFAAASLTTGILTIFIDMRYFFFIFVFAMSLGVFSISKINDVSMTKDRDINKAKVKFDTRLIIFFIGTFFVAGTLIANINYFSVLFVEAGGTPAGAGIVLFLCALSEAPVMSIVNRLIKKYGYERLLIFMAVMCVGRWLLYGSRPSAILIITTFFMQGIICGIYVPASLGYLKSIVDEDRLVSTMGLYSSICSGLSVLAFQYFGGYIMDKSNIFEVYILFGAVCIISVGCYYALYKLKFTEKKLASQM